MTPTPTMTGRTPTPSYVRQESKGQLDVAKIPEDIPEGDENESDSSPHSSLDIPTPLLLARARKSTSLENPKDSPAENPGFESTVVVNNRRPGLVNVNSFGTSMSSIDTAYLEASETEIPHRDSAPPLLLKKSEIEEVYMEEDVILTSTGADIPRNDSEFSIPDTRTLEQQIRALRKEAKQIQMGNFPSPQSPRSK